MSWSDLTVAEIKKTLSEYNIEYNANECKRKAQLVEVCEGAFTASQLIHVLRDYGKWNESASALPRGRALSSNRSKRANSSQKLEERLASSSPEGHLEAVIANRDKSPPSPFDSLAASYDARREYQQRRAGRSSVPAQVNDGRLKTTAGRFSVPSDSPRRRGTGRSSVVQDTASPMRNARASIGVAETPSVSKPAYGGSSARNHGSPFMVRTAPPQPTLLKSSIDLPFLDPEGNPVRWKVRDPFIVDLSPVPSKFVSSKFRPEASKDERLSTSNRDGDQDDPERSHKRKSIHRLTNVNSGISDSDALSHSRGGEPKKRSASRDVRKKRKTVATTTDFDGDANYQRRRALKQNVSASGPFGFSFPWWARKACLTAGIPIMAMILYSCVPGQLPEVMNQKYMTVKDFFVPLPFCDSGDGRMYSENHNLNPGRCLKCPENATCLGGILKCNPQYKKQWHHGGYICVKDTALFTKAQKLLDLAADHLAREAGRHQCHYTPSQPSVPIDLRAEKQLSPVEGRDLRTSLGLTRCHLHKYLDRTRWAPSKSADFEAQSAALFDTLLEQPSTRERYGIRKRQATIAELRDLGNSPIRCFSAAFDQSNESSLYYSVRPVKPILCQLREVIQRYILYVLGVAMGVWLTVARYRRWRVRREAMAAIKRLITENTNIQLIASAGATRQGYAVGPRAHDLWVIMGGEEEKKSGTLFARLFTSRVKEQKSEDRSKKGGGNEAFGEGHLIVYDAYRHITRALTEKQIAQMCEELVKRDSFFCRSILSLDMVPFYYSKRVIDRLRLSGATASGGRTEESSNAAAALISDANKSDLSMPI